MTSGGDIVQTFSRYAGLIQPFLSGAKQ